MQKNDKKMSKLSLNDMDLEFKKKNNNINTNPGVLKFGDPKTNSKKIQLKQYFESQETEIFTIRFDFWDELIAVGCSDGQVRVYNQHLNKLESQFKCYSNDDAAPVTCLRWRPTTHCPTKQVLVTVNADGSIMHWHAKSGKPLHRMVQPDQSILCLDYNKDGSQFVTSGNDFHVRVYDEDSKTQIIDFKPADWNQPGHSNRVFCVKFVEDDPNLILSSGWDANLHIWDIRQKQSVAAFYGPNVSGDAIDYLDGQILTGSYRTQEQLQLWDFKTRKLIQNINWETSYKNDQAYVYSAQFDKNNGDVLACSAGINELKLFSKEDQYKPCASILEQKEGLYCVNFNQNCSKFAFGGAEGILYIMSL
ncbi:WD40-repeat-containing domain [Pseudocohnilembus persalinus]|uniref:WD40-repeat-containing domain n=1 Tax=Pseudocohnilembus persalinus TaxID=266149 RepID=A0A0V0QIX5_PSEPJ|nr:WD40-repeat-containing domain [Pseudocohnilembus persalinus]|eukprot:KRX02042.1 WD40-repeat-containing domain [Pseudocohnilembus persalinus]